MYYKDDIFCTRRRIEVSNKREIPNILTEKDLVHDIETFVEENPAANPVEKGHLFTEWVLKFLFERSDDEIEFDMELSGAGDNSVDAWFEDGQTLHIIQTKYKTAHNKDAFAGFLSDMERLLSNPYATIGNKQDFYEFSNVLKMYVENDEENEMDGEKRIQLHYVTSAQLTDDFGTRVTYEKERIENHYPNVSLNVYGIKEINEFILLSLQELPSEYRKVPKKLMLKNYFVTGDSCVAEVELKEFAKFVKNNHQYLFFSNIRNYLGGTKINKEIQKTFQETPTNFWYFNNGITIICEDFDHISLKNSLSNSLPIYAPQIVNGCQTANAIYEGFRNMKDPEKQKNLQGCILVKIIKDKNKNRVNDIIKYTNRQNTVSAMDFFALDKFHQDLRVKFGSLGYNYEIQRKAGRFLDRKQKKRQYNFGPNNQNKSYAYLFPDKFDYKLPVKQVVQAYAAGMHYKPGTAGSRSGELAPGGSTSEEIFNENTPKNPLYFLFPFAVMSYAKNKLGYGATRGKKNTEQPTGNRRRKQVDFRRNCLMLFVAVYFRLLVRFMKELGYLNKHENDNPLTIPIEVLESIFKNERVNKELLQAADDVISSYITDEAVKQLIKDNLPKFLKTDVQKNEQAIDYMIQKIDFTIERIPDDVYNRFDEIVRTAIVQSELIEVN